MYRWIYRNPKYEDKKTLYVGNLLNENADKDLLKETFKGKGEIENVEVKYLSGKRDPACIAFINFNSESGVDEALKVKHELGEISLAHAFKRQDVHAKDRSIAVNMKSRLDLKEGEIFANHLEDTFGEVENIYSKEVVVVSFVNKGSKEKALKQGNITYDGECLTVRNYGNTQRRADRTQVTMQANPQFLVRNQEHRPQSSVPSQPRGAGKIFCQFGVNHRFNRLYGGTKISRTVKMQYQSYQ